MERPLLSCSLKINRASKHLFDLNAAIGKLADIAPHEILTDDHTDEFTRIYSLGEVKPVPPEFGCYFGDAIHNLRSALDALAVALVKRAGHTDPNVIQATYFPIKEKGPRFNPTDEKFFERIGQEAADFVKAVEPYPGGRGDWLVDIHQLNNIDKHRAIIPIDAVTLPTGIVVSGGNRGTFKAAPKLATKYGDEIGRWISEMPHYYPAAHFTHLIVLNEPGRTRGRAVGTFLQERIDFIERIMKTFAINVFKGTW